MRSNRWKSVTLQQHYRDNDKLVSPRSQSKIYSIGQFLPKQSIEVMNSAALTHLVALIVHRVNHEKHSDHSSTSNLNSIVFPF